MNCSKLSNTDTKIALPSSRNTVAITQSSQSRTQRCVEFIRHHKTPIIATCSAIALIALGALAMSSGGTTDTTEKSERLSKLLDTGRKKLDKFCTDVANRKGLDGLQKAISHSYVSNSNELVCYADITKCKSEACQDFLQDVIADVEPDAPYFGYKACLNGGTYNGGVPLFDEDMEKFPFLKDFPTKTEHLNSYPFTVQWKLRC